jgi:hypothetical protein
VSNQNHNDNKIDTQIYPKSKEILREQLVYELKLGNKNLKKKINHMYKGLKGFFLNPIIRVLYSIFIGPDIRDDMIAQIDDMLNAAEIMDGREDNEEFWEKWTKQYCDHDPWLKRCDKTHKIYPEILEMFEDGFQGSVKEFNKTLHTKANNYEELARGTFTREELVENFETSLRVTRETMEKVINTKGLLQIPSLIRDEVVKIMRVGFEYAEKLAWSKIEKIYPE